MSQLRERMIEDMQLRGLSKRTQESYVGAVKQLAKYYNKSPDELREEELRGYFVYLVKEKQVAGSTCSQALSAVKFLYQYTLKRKMPILDIIRPNVAQKLPEVLSQGEVKRVLGQVRKRHYRVCLSTIYACGLRLQEGVFLQVKDIDSARMMLHIRGGKGNKDRYVPLPQSSLEQLRQHWATHQHPVWLFPRRNLDTVKPMDKSGVQRAFRGAVQESRLHKAVSVHSLRHSYATHLLEAGINLRLIQRYLGHNSLGSTVRYTRLTPQIEAQAVQTINALMADLP